MTDRTPTISAAEYRALNAVPKPKKHKYNARKTRSADGTEFPSAFECAVYDFIRLFMKKEYRIEKLQVPVRLARGTFHVDFLLTNLKTGEPEWHEAKGLRTNAYIRNREDWKKEGPGILEVWTGDYKRPRIDPTQKIIPKHMREE